MFLYRFGFHGSEESVAQLQVDNVSQAMCADYCHEGFSLLLLLILCTRYHEQLFQFGGTATTSIILWRRLQSLAARLPICGSKQRRYLAQAIPTQCRRELLVKTTGYDVLDAFGALIIDELYSSKRRWRWYGT